MSKIDELMKELEGMKSKHAEVVAQRSAAQRDLGAAQKERGDILLAGDDKRIKANTAAIAAATATIADSDAMLAVLLERLEATARAIYNAEFDAALAEVTQLETVTLPALVAETKAALSAYRDKAASENAVRSRMMSLVGAGGVSFMTRRAELLGSVEVANA